MAYHRCFCDSGGATEWGTILGNIANQTDLIYCIKEKTKNKKEKYLINKAITIWDTSVWYSFSGGLNADTYYTGTYKTNATTSVGAYEISRVEASDGTGTIEFLVVTTTSVILCKCTITKSGSTYTSAWTTFSMSSGEKALASYPVGSYYISESATSPASLFGGIWTRIKDKVLIGAGNLYSVGSTGGEAKHTLTKAELPRVTGEIDVSNDVVKAKGCSTGHIVGNGMQSGVLSAGSGSNVRCFAYADFMTHPDTLNHIKFNVGSDTPHNNLPPYIAVNIWKRTA